MKFFVGLIVLCLVGYAWSQAFDAGFADALASLDTRFRKWSWVDTPNGRIFKGVSIDKDFNQVDIDAVRIVALKPCFFSITYHRTGIIFVKKKTPQLVTKVFIFRCCQYD